jgi:hypothetical protein
VGSKSQRILDHEIEINQPTPLIEVLMVEEQIPHCTPHKGDAFTSCGHE